MLEIQYAFIQIKKIEAIILRKMEIIIKNICLKRSLKNGIDEKNIQIWGNAIKYSSSPITLQKKRYLNGAETIIYQRLSHKSTQIKALRLKTQ